MYACPGCGADLKYNVPLRKMKCDHCGSDYDVKDISSEGSYKNEKFETNVFICSQCGGEIYSQEMDLTGYCTYCGTHQVFKNRIEKMDRPKWIIPFKVSKEECKKAYVNCMNKAFFAPKGMKNAEYIDDIRGVYMPYWFHNYSYDNDITMVTNSKKGNKHYSDYFTTEDYRLNFHIKADYPTMINDASYWFSNDISDQIKPFNLRNDMEDFSPAYLSGFYGETADVEADKSDKSDLQDVKDSIDRLVKSKFDKFDMDYKSSQYNKPKKEETRIGLLPVWFMSYRNKNRVSYASINGQTGKFTAEIPVSIGKFAICSGILAVLLFMILNAFWIMKPEYVAMLAAVASCLALVFSQIDLNIITRKKCGYANGSRKDGNVEVAVSVLVLALLAVIIILDSFSVLAKAPTFFMRVLPICVCIYCLIRGIVEYVMLYKDSAIRKSHIVGVFPGYHFSFLGVVLATVVEIISPVNDEIYFGVGFVSMAFAIISLISVIHYHNVMSSRALPQFKHMGGDNDAV